LILVLKFIITNIKAEGFLVGDKDVDIVRKSLFNIPYYHASYSNSIELSLFLEALDQAFDYLKEFVKSNLQVLHPEPQTTKQLEWECYVEDIYSKFFKTAEDIGGNDTIQSVIYRLFQILKEKDLSTTKKLLENVNIHTIQWSHNSYEVEPD
jgi:hypothetical protein